MLCASALSHCARMSVPTAKPEQQPLFSFGVIADVQWADTEDGSNYDRTVLRRYRGAFRTLERAVGWWNLLLEPPTFIAQLGDIIDGVNVDLGQSDSALEAALAALRRAPCPAVNIVGNHELYNFDRAQLARAPWLKHGDKEYHSFQPAAGWRVVPHGQKSHPWRCPSSAPAPPQADPGGPVRLGTPRVRPSLWGSQPRPQLLERASSLSALLSIVAHSTAFDITTTAG